MTYFCLFLCCTFFCFVYCFHFCQTPTLTQLNSKQIGVRLDTVVTWNTNKLWNLIDKPWNLTANFSATSRHARKLKFYTATHYSNLIQLTNCHRDICPGNICLCDICLYQEYLSSYWSDFGQTLKIESWDHV